MSARSLLLPVLALLLGLACSPFHVDADWDPAQDFTGLVRWTFAPIPGTEGGGTDPRLASDLLHRRIRAAIEAELAAKGCVRDDARPDFWVVYHVAIDQRVDVDTVYRAVPYGRWGSIRVPENRVRAYEAGTLVVDVLLPGDGRLVWRGTAVTRISKGLRPEERDQRVREAVHAVLADFPPAA